MHWKQAQRSTAIGAAICHRAQAFNLRSGDWEEAAKPLIWKTEQITGEIHGPAQQTTALCFQAFCFPVAICYYICLTGIRQPIAHKSSMLLNDTMNILWMLQPPQSKLHITQLFWMRVEDPQLSLDHLPFCSRSDCTGGLGRDLELFIPPTCTFNIATLAVVGKREKGGHPRENTSCFNFSSSCIACYHIHVKYNRLGASSITSLEL